MFISWLRVAFALLAAWVTYGGFGSIPDSARASGPAASLAPKEPKPDEAELQPAEFARLRALIRPQPGESRWADLPWENSLRAARTKAAAEGKPIFILGAASGPATGFC
jgi:hypothetical protein